MKSYAVVNLLESPRVSGGERLVRGDGENRRGRKRLPEGSYSIEERETFPKISIYPAETQIYNHCGDDSREVPPVLIPNTEVKLSYAEST